MLVLSFLFSVDNVFQTIAPQRLLLMFLDSLNNSDHNYLPMAPSPPPPPPSTKGKRCFTGLILKVCAGLLTFLNIVNKNTAVVGK